MEKILYTYALVKTLSDHNEDYADTFFPLIVQIFPEDEELALYAIQRNLREEFQLNIPSHPLEYILKRAKDFEYVHINKWDRYSLTKKGIDIKQKIVPQRDIQRQINGLIEDIKKYFLEHHIELNNDQITELINSLFKRDFDPILRFIQTYKKDDQLEIKNADSREQILIKYVINVEKNDNERYILLKQMFYGSLISTLLYSDEPEKTFALKNTKFNNCDIYLDTNFIFSLLNLHRTPEVNQASKELLNLIKKYNFKIKVFSFTISEIVRVIGGYSDGNHSNIPEGEEVYSTLLKLGWTKSKVIEFNSKIEETLVEQGILIERVEGFDYRTFRPKRSDLIELLKSYRIRYNENSIIHDIAAIEKIQEIREHPVRNLEKVKAVFLTSDLRLNSFNLYGMGHKENKTIGEVILDRLFTTMLWLVNPKIELSLSAIMSTHSQGLLVKWDLFDKFFKTVEEMKKEGKISDEQIETLFYNNYITEELSHYREEENGGLFTPAIIHEKIETAFLLKEKTIFEQKKIKEEIEQLIHEREKIRNDFVQSQNENAKIFDNIKKQTSYLFLLLKSFAFFSIIGTSLGAFIITSNATWLSLLLIPIAILTLCTHLFGSFSQTVDNIEERFSNWRFSRLKK